MPMPDGLRPALAVLLFGAIAACEPTLNWREVRPDGTPLVVLFPCRPDRHERSVVLAARPVVLTLLNCSAGGGTFALSFGSVSDVEAVAPVLDALRTSVAHNLGATSQVLAQPFVADGMTPNVNALQMHVAGKRPDSSSVEADVAVFSAGLQVVQLQVLAARPDPDATQTFLKGARVER